MLRVPPGWKCCTTQCFANVGDGVCWDSHDWICSHSCHQHYEGPWTLWYCKGDSSHCQTQHPEWTSTPVLQHCFWQGQQDWNGMNKGIILIMIGTEKEDVIKWENCIDHYISMFIVPIIETNEGIIDDQGRKHKTHGVNQVPHGLLDHWLLVPKRKPPHHSWLTVTNMCLIYIQQGLIEWLGNKCHPTHASTRGTTPKRPASHHQRPANIMNTRQSVRDDLPSEHFLLAEECSTVQWQTLEPRSLNKLIGLLALIGLPGHRVFRANFMHDSIRRRVNA